MSCLTHKGCPMCDVDLRRHDCWNCGADQAKLLDEETVELRADRDRLAAELKEHQEIYVEMLSTQVRLHGRVEALEAELKDVLEYAGHKKDCDFWIPVRTTICTCGWTATRERHAKGRTT